MFLKARILLALSLWCLLPSELGAQLARIPDEASWRADIDQGTALRDRELYSDAAMVFERALQKAESFGPNDVRIAVTLNSLALVHHLRKDFEQAGPLYERSAELLRIALGSDHPEIAKILSSLYELYIQQGKLDAAERAGLDRLSILEKQLGKSNPQLVQPLADVSLVYFRKNQLLDAELYQRRSLAISRAGGPEADSEKAKALSNLGVILATDNRLANAVEALKESLQLRQSGSPESIEVARDLGHLANAYSKRLQFAEAELLLIRSLELRRKHLTSKHPEIAAALNNLGELYRLQREYDRAEENLRAAVEVWEAVNGPGDIETGVSLYNLAALFEEQNRLDEAAPLFGRAADVMEQKLGPGNQRSQQVREAFDSVCARVDAASCPAVR